MKTNKFIENSTKELLDRLKESFANKNVEYKESDQLALLRRISNIKMSICTAEIHIIELLQQNAIDIKVLTNATEKVPLLGDIPVLGNLFKYQKKQDNQEELLIFITPRIMSATGSNLRY